MLANKKAAPPSFELPSFRTPWLLALLVITLCFFLLDIALGSVHIPTLEILKMLLGEPGQHGAWEKILFNIRLPKAVTAVFAGMALSVSGLQMQTFFRNPLAGPSVLGITAGASLGVALVLLGVGQAASLAAIKEMGLGGSWLIVAAATTGAGLIFFLILMVSIRIDDHVTLLIVGLMVANITIAVVSIWQYFSNPEQIQDYLLWTFGSLSGVSKQQLPILSGAVLLGILATFSISKQLNLLLLGPRYAQSMGLHTPFVKVVIIAITSLLAGAITGFCGPIGFIGIAVPHLCRSLFNTSDHRLLIPACCLVGASILLLCDVIAQLPGSQGTLPINSVTALLGSPVVLWVILKQKNTKGMF